MHSKTRRRVEAGYDEGLGQPPRLLPLDRESVAEQVLADTAHLRGGFASDGPPLPLDTIPEIIFTKCRYPDM